MIKFAITYLLVTIYIVNSADVTAKIVPGSIIDNDNNNRSTEFESTTNNISSDQILDLFNKEIKKSIDSEVVTNYEIPAATTTRNLIDLSDQDQSPKTVTILSSEPTYIQTIPKRNVTTSVPTVLTQVPRKRLSTLPPIPTLATAAPLNNAHLLRGWIADEIAVALWAFAPQPSSNPKCTLHSQLYRNSINNFTTWAMQMLDSSNRIPSGILSGNEYQLGHFDQCIKISVPHEDLDGKYCLPTIGFAPSKEIDPEYGFDENLSFEEPHPYESAYEYFKPHNDLSRRPRDVIHWAVCVPQSCTVQDVNEALNVALVEPLSGHGIAVNVSLTDDKCYARREERPVPTGFFVILGIFVLLFVIVVFATWMDMYYYQNNRSHSKNLRIWMIWFSAYTNLSKLIKPNPEKEFSEFHFLKLYVIICVIIGHREMLMFGPAPIANPGWVEWLHSKFLSVYFLNGSILVDCFFFMSGFLTCHYIYQELNKRKSLNLIIIILNRWIRIVPTYMFVMAVYGWFLPYIGDGPLWDSRIGLESGRCVRSWWTNILFINNYVNSEDQCMVQSWYLACDMHFFIVGALLVYAVWKWPTAGEFLLWFTFFVSCAIPGYVTYKNRYWGIVLFYNSFDIDPVSNEQFRNIYMKSHNRFGPYMVGIFGAHILYKLKQKNYKFSLPGMIIGSLITATISFAAITSACIFFMRARPYSIVESVLYAAIHRSMWAIGFVFFFIAEATNGYGILYDCFKHPFFVAFGRLSYCAYLVHLLPMLVHTASSRLPSYLDFIGLVHYSNGDVVMTFILALLLNLLFEAPLERLQKEMINELLTSYDKKGQLGHEKKFNSEMTEVGVNNPAMD